MGDELGKTDGNQVVKGPESQDKQFKLNAGNWLTMRNSVIRKVAQYREAKGKDYFKKDTLLKKEMDLIVVRLLMTFKVTVTEWWD